MAMLGAAELGGAEREIHFVYETGGCGNGACEGGGRVPREVGLRWASDRSGDPRALTAQVIAVIYIRNSFPRDECLPSFPRSPNALPNSKRFDLSDSKRFDPRRVAAR
jgi:hypothetical protein